MKVNTFQSQHGKRQHHMKIKILGSNLFRNETFEEPMRGDRQKFRPIRSEQFSPWASFWKDGDLRSLAKFSFRLSPETVKQFVILMKMINKNSFFLSSFFSNIRE
jgi:hypothetical protein